MLCRSLENLADLASCPNISEFLNSNIFPSFLSSFDYVRILSLCLSGFATQLVHFRSARAQRKHQGTFYVHRATQEPLSSWTEKVNSGSRHAFLLPDGRAGLSACRTGDRNVTWHGPGPAWHRFKDFTSPKVLGLLGLLALLGLLGLLGLLRLLRLLDSGHLHDLIEFLLVPASQVWDLKQKKEVISFQADWGSNSADFGAPAQNSWKCQMSKEIKYLRDRTDSFELNLERKSKWIESLSLNLLGSWWFFSIPFLDRFAELCRRILQVAYAAQAWLGIPRCRKTHGKCRKQGWVMVSHGESLCDRLCEPPCESLRVSLDIT